jgi:pSer/pThr/pTyr-binding forkhead associated (FHA) protein
MPDYVSGYFVIEGSNVTLQIPKGKKTIIIGREDPVSGVFPEIDLDQHGGQDAGVGRRHAQLFLQGGQLLIEDLDSVNGTVVNRHKISARQPHPVRDGDEIRLGKMVMIYHTA